ncbi:metallophosphoesterase [Deltaproteobacteria bacterium TL4]
MRQKNEASKKFKVLLLTAVLVLGTVSGYKVKDKLVENGCELLGENVIPLDVQQADPETLRFLAVGDTGVGDENQKKVAKGMDKVCTAQGCDFVLLLGDNFYEKGVKSIQDPQFQTAFEQIYEPIKKPFFAVLGNHDVNGNALSQVIYSMKSPMWRMPNYEYQFEMGSARFFALNTNCHVSTLERLRQRLIPGEKPWTFVFGHHTVFSSGKHGDSDIGYRLFWKHFLQKNVDFYISGHDHYLGHLARAGEGTQYIVSGAGAKQYGSAEEKKEKTASGVESKFVYNANGFVGFQVTSQKVTVQYYDVDGNQLYEFSK